MSLLPCVEIEPKTTARASVIWLHGLGANGHDFASLVPELKIADSLGIRYIFPHAPRRPISLNAGYLMPAWYDIHGITLESREDAAGLQSSAIAINQLIQRECERGIASHKIILAGFSQGGALAVYTGLRYSETLAGILVLSAYLPLAKTIAAESNKANQHTPILVLHGTQDKIVPMAWGELAYTTLQQHHYPAQWQTFPMGHTVCLAEIKMIAEWITQCIKP